MTTTEVPLKTSNRLELMVFPARPNMKPTKKLLYANPATGTIVYHVFTSNTTLPRPVSEHITWAHFLVGNEDGYFVSDCYVSSEASICISGVTEDVNTVTIRRNGTKTIHFGLKIPVGDLVFEKSEFKVYPREVLGAAGGNPTGESNA